MSDIYYNRGKAEPIVRLETVKAWMKMRADITEYDQILNILINSVSQEFENYIDAPLINRRFLEIHDGDGADAIVTANRPIREVHHIHIDVSSEFSNLDTEQQKLDSPLRLRDENYLTIDSDHISMIDSSIDVFDPFGRNSYSGAATIRVEYTSGHASTIEDMPADVTHAALERIEQLYMDRENRTYNVTDKRSGDSSFSKTLNWPPHVKQVLDNYRDPGFGKHNRTIKKVYTL